MSCPPPRAEPRTHHLPIHFFSPQGQLRDKDRRLQTMATQLVETEDKAAQLQADLGLARSACVALLKLLCCAGVSLLA